MKAFEAAYNKTAEDLVGLKLEEQHFQASPTECAWFFPEMVLSDGDARQPLIVVFGEFVPTACR